MRRQQYDGRGWRRDVLHVWDGALAHERDGHRMGADAVARDAGGVGGVEDGRITMILLRLVLLAAAYLVLVRVLWRETPLA